MATLSSLDTSGTPSIEGQTLKVNLVASYSADGPVTMRLQAQPPENVEIQPQSVRLPAAPGGREHTINGLRITGSSTELASVRIIASIGASQASLFVDFPKSSPVQPGSPR